MLTSGRTTNCKAEAMTNDEIRDTVLRRVHQAEDMVLVAEHLIRDEVTKQEKFGAKSDVLLGALAGLRVLADRELDEARKRLQELDGTL